MCTAKVDGRRFAVQQLVAEHRAEVEVGCCCPAAWGQAAFAGKVAQPAFERLGGRSHVHGTIQPGKCDEDQQVCDRDLGE